MGPARTIDLRSDTVTQPTPAMRRAMAEAQVGDDVFGDDPTVNALQQRVAAMFNKPAALFVPSGTMANQVAIRAHTEPGCEMICHRLSHVYLYEGGAPFALSGCSVALLDGPRGMFTAEDVQQAVRADDQHFPRSALVVVENTHNRGGGSVWKMSDIARISSAARELELKLHLDGARIMNACAASGHNPAEYADHFDSVSICFSKGLGAPVGSAVAGSREFIARALRFRKMFGGAMRQAGVLCAAADHALDHHVGLLARDHENAARLGNALEAFEGVTVTPPETNILYIDVDPRFGGAGKVEERAQEHGVRVLALGPHQLRAVTHLQITKEDVDLAADRLRSALAECNSL